MAGPGSWSQVSRAHVYGRPGILVKPAACPSRAMAAFSFLVCCKFRQALLQVLGYCLDVTSPGPEALNRVIRVSGLQACEAVLGLLMYTGECLPRMHPSLGVDLHTGNNRCRQVVDSKSASFNRFGD